MIFLFLDKILKIFDFISKNSNNFCVVKQLISLLSEHYDFDFKLNQSYKFDAKWHNGENMLIVNMNGGR